MTGRSVAIPARLSLGDEGDPRVEGANRIFHDVVELVRANGLEPVIVHEVDLEGFAGVVLPGGGDIDPELYGGASSDAVYDVNPAQDQLDLGLARRAIELDIPVLGICRGAQVLNVAFRGTLHADLAPSSVEHYHVPGPSEELDFLWHPVTIAEGTALHRELGMTEIVVASGHHQGIDRLGAGLRAVSVAEDGLVEAFEDQSGRRLGVQWHPEAATTGESEQNAPFRVFEAVVAGVSADA